MAPDLDSRRWELISGLFHQALDLEPVARGEFLERSCREDRELLREVAAMLEAHTEEPSLAIEERLFSDGDAARAAAAVELPAGTRLGPYRIVALVGHGGMGEVYRAERVDGEFRQTVALKVLRPGYRTAETVRRFRLERQVLARLVHPGIVAILDGGTTEDGRPYLVLQYVEGLPVTRFCTERRLALDARLRLFLRIAEAVQFAHGQLVVHRDIKPANILVQPDGTPRLLDFGIAKLLDRSPGDSEAAATGSEIRLLTPEHAAPEQLRGEPVGTAADVYGLGGLLFELLTGQRPFAAVGRTISELEHAILTEPPPSPSSVAPPAERKKLRGDLDRIVLMALRKEPERRYQFAGQFAEDVERYLDALPVRAQPDTLRYRAGKFIARNRVWVGAGLLLVLLLTGFSITMAVQSRRIAGERDRAEREKAAAEDVANILTGLIQRTNPLLAAGADTLRAAQLVDEAERQVAELKQQPEHQARLWRSLGNQHLARGLNASAKKLLRQAWDGLRAVKGPDDVEAAMTYHHYARAVLAHDGEAAARPMFDTSLARLRRLLGEDHPDVGTALLDLASATVDPTASEQALNQVAAIRARLPTVDSVAFASLLNAQGSARFGRGEYRDALALFEAALRIMAVRLPPENPDRLGLMSNVASALGQLGEWRRAEGLVLAAIEARGGIVRARPGDLERLALLAAHQGRLEEAETRERGALEAYRAVGAPDHALVDNALRNLGIIVAARGRVEEGLALLDSAVARRTAAGANAGYMIAQRAPLLLRLDRIEEAAASIARGDSLVRPTVPAGSVQLGDLDLWAGMVAMARGDAAAAADRLSTARELYDGLMPATHPKRASATCALGAAMVARGGPRVAEAEPLLQAGCPILAQWGMADPLIKEWGEQARKRPR